MMGWIRRLKRRIRWLRIRVWEWTKSLPNSTAFWLTLVAIVLVCSIVLPFASWDWLRSGASGGGAESNSTTIRNVGFLIAGVLALVFAVWRGVLAQRQAEAAQRQSETSQQGLLNERYQKGAEMLGSEILSVRLAGIYALQRLAEEHPEQYHIQIMQLFCAYVRNPTGEAAIPVRRYQDDGEPVYGLREDVQAVMYAIGSRSEVGIALEDAAENFRLDLRNVDLQHSDLSDLNLCDADLSNANLSNADIENANLCNADLDNANVYNANLTDADLSDVNLIDARLIGAYLSDANLSNASLNRANLSDALLNLANLSNASLNRANLSNANFWFAGLSFATLSNANLNGADLEIADLTGASFEEADLEDANLTGASFSGGWVPALCSNPATGLTQAQLDEARSDPENPPNLNGVLDAETGEPLVWNGKPLDDDP